MSEVISIPGGTEKKTAIAATVKCFAGRLHGRKADQPIIVDCNIVAEMEEGTVTLNIPGRDIIVSLRFDELLEIMSEGIVLSHQLDEQKAKEQEPEGTAGIVTVDHQEGGAEDASYEKEAGAEAVEG